MSMIPVRSNEEWLQALTGTDQQRDEAISELRQFLLKVCLYTLFRYSKDIRALNYAERLALAEDCAQEALIRVLDHLGEFHAESKFTTWAYKFAVNVSLAYARREGWKRILLEHPPDSVDTFDWLTSLTASTEPDLELQALRAEVISIFDEVIQNDLSEKQRQVFKMIVFEQIPMDAIVQHFGMNRSAVYKLLHDARKKLKKALKSHGVGLDEIYRLFGK